MFLYNLSLRFYGTALRLVAPFHAKARKWVRGRKDLWKNLKEALHKNQKPVVWFHVSSLGEFEQARPVIEGLRAREGNSFFLLLSFFSPSGFEVRKDYKEADYVTYLPLDLPAHARQWIEIVQPVEVYWVKYDFWWNVLREMQARNIPVTLFSAVFRKEQFFFKSPTLLSILKKFKHIFVQNEESLRLLVEHDFQNAQIAGDTRFDRVCATVESFEPIPLIERWLGRQGRQDVLVAGSVWGRDLDVILPVLAKHFPATRLIFAPHEMHEGVFQQIERALPAQTIRFSELATQIDTSKNIRTLLIDNVGMLSKLYHYGTLAYIGGAFKEGLHNILEPAVFGIPVIFGKDYRKFPEAAALIRAGGAFSIQDEASFLALLQGFEAQESKRAEAGRQASAYIMANQGGAEKILALK